MQRGVLPFKGRTGQVLLKVSDEVSLKGPAQEDTGLFMDLQSPSRMLPSRTAAQQAAG